MEFISQIKLFSIIEDIYKEFYRKKINANNNVIYFNFLISDDNIVYCLKIINKETKLKNIYNFIVQHINVNS
jgi:hypothetical protein